MPENRNKPPVKFVKGNSPGWRVFNESHYKIWIKGILAPSAFKELLNVIDDIMNKKKPSQYKIENIYGSFGVVFCDESRLYAITDHFCSVPILIASDKLKQQYFIGTSGSNLIEEIGGCRESDVDLDSVLSISMAGYTIGNRTIHKAIKILPPFSFTQVSQNKGVKTKSYAVYSPWKATFRTRTEGKKNLKEELEKMFERLIESVNGAPIIVPLSAGFDSRLMVAGLKHFNYKNVRCFSYGLKNNYEAKTAQYVADKLGYEWSFIPYTLSKQKDVYKSKDYDAFLLSADCLSGVQFEQEYLAIRSLLEGQILQGDAVILNGQSGDFITGNHIPSKLFSENSAENSEKDNGAEWLSYSVAKHFSLWEALLTKTNIQRIETLLIQEVANQIPSVYQQTKPHAVYEWSEYNNRQCKYVVQNVRTYEHFGIEWRMPLWDRQFIEFWSNATLEEKSHQNLYKEVIFDLDWGGVWETIPINTATIKPDWIKVVRFMLKCIHAPLGRKKWHKFERRFLNYWMSNICSDAIIPYLESIMNTKGPRSAVAWWSQKYLDKKGLDFFINEKDKI